MNEPREHHYVPQFYLRNFAVDPEKLKIETVAKNGDMAVWAMRSIESLGYERDLYVHVQNGSPISVETAINQSIETPISTSDTWQKIVTGRADALDASDKATLYALIRHFYVRTPFTFATEMELAAMAADPNSNMAFSDEERQHFRFLHNNPDQARALFNRRASNLRWTERDYRHARISIYRSPIPLRTASVPVMSLKVPHHPSLVLPLPGMTPYELVLPLSPTTIATLVQADFEDRFYNFEIPIEVAMGFNLHRVGLFAHFDAIRHLVTRREGIVEAMTWAPYDLIKDTPNKVVFRRRPVIIR